MKPLSDWPASDRARIRGVLTDIDDTLTEHGAITPDALAALQRLRAAGLPVFAITGRPAGWSEPFARSWPLNAIVAENGAVALWRDGATGSLRKAHLQDAATRHANAERLRAVARLIQQQVPQARLADDSAGRETDIAIDHAEHHHLPPDAVARVVALMQAHGLRATVSSIHVNGWIGDHDKLAGARWILREHLGVDLDADAEHWAFVGDSRNDESLFAHLPNSVGVANIARVWPQLRHRPRCVTQAERGAGFAEMADALLAARAPFSPHPTT